MPLKKGSLISNYPEILKLVAFLRSEEGNSWDREQNLDSMKSYFIEEAYELFWSIEEGKLDSIKEEAGDLLMLLAMLCEILNEQGKGDFQEVDKFVCQKIKSRLPHVFNKKENLSSGQVQKNWDELKNKADFHVSKGAPALTSVKIGKKMADLGFEWPNVPAVLSQVKEELAELEEELLKDEKSLEVREELGDLYFSLNQLSRKLNICPDKVNNEANQKFCNRINKILEQNQIKLKDFAELSMEEKEALWNKAKKNS